MRRSLRVVPCVLFLALACQSQVQANPPVNNERDYKLLTAAATGDTMAIRRLNPRKTNLEARDMQYGFTPLMWAAWKANIGTMRELIRKGADVNAATSFANPANVVLHEGDKPTFIGNMPFFVRNSGVTPLLLAASSGSGMAVQELLKNGANIRARPASGESALQAAVYTGSLSGVKALLAKGADPHEIIPTPFPTNAALFIAILRGHEEIVKELLRADVDVIKPLHIFGNYENLALRSGKPSIAILIDQARQKQLKAARKTKSVSKSVGQNTKVQSPQRETVKIISSDGSVQVVR
jgi:ankyrin repeat protein